MDDSTGATAAVAMPAGRKEKAKKPDRGMDFSAYPQRHIVIKLAYDGRDFDGLARQVNTINTIEHVLIQALVRVKLVPPLQLSPEADSLSQAERDRLLVLAGPDKFSRCGRTDRGVSALGNAVSVMVRGSKPGQPELQYTQILNRALPETIRVVAWSYVAPNFDARFSCIGRTYRYFFSTTGRDIAAMAAAAKKLEGSHDFRNLCKMDVVNVSNFVREMRSVTLRSALTDAALVPRGDGTVDPSLGDVAYAEIHGNAFLYHQIRCIMAVLFMVADRHEAPSIIDELLDLESNPSKPCYAMACEYELVLWDCAFRPEDVSWVVDDSAFGALCLEFEQRARDYQVRSAMQRCMRKQVLDTFESKLTTATRIEDVVLLGGKDKSKCRHVPLWERPVEHTFEEKVEGLSETKKHRREVNQSHSATGRDRFAAARGGEE